MKASPRVRALRCRLSRESIVIENTGSWRLHLQPQTVVACGGARRDGQILTLVRARYPMLQLVSHEEERVTRGVDRLAADEDRPRLPVASDHRSRGA